MYVTPHDRFEIRKRISMHLCCCENHGFTQKAFQRSNPDQQCDNSILHSEFESFLGTNKKLTLSISNIKLKLKVRIVTNYFRESWMNGKFSISISREYTNKTLTKFQIFQLEITLIWKKELIYVTLSDTQNAIMTHK